MKGYVLMGYRRKRGFGFWKIYITVLLICALAVSVFFTRGRPAMIAYAESVAQTAARYGVYFTPGDNERIAGWMQCHYRLQFDENGYPRMYVFKNCRAFIRTVPLMLYSQTRPEDLDTAMEDHVCDEWRYFCMSRPVKPMMQAQTAAVWSDPLNQLK